MENLTDIREHDVPYHVRVSIDKKINVGSWYDVTFSGSEEPPTITRKEDLLERPVSCTKFKCNVNFPIIFNKYLGKLKKFVSKLLNDPIKTSYCLQINKKYVMSFKYQK